MKIRKIPITLFKFVKLLKYFFSTKIIKRRLFHFLLSPEKLVNEIFVFCYYAYYKTNSTRGTNLFIPMYCFYIAFLHMSYLLMIITK